MRLLAPSIPFALGPPGESGYIGHMKRLLPALLIGLARQATLAQCGPCTVGDTCTVDPPFPTVCPAITPVGTVGVPYGLDVTFWIPPSFPEPTTQLNVVLQEVTLVSMENVPLGLTYEASSPTLTYYPQTDPFGCVRVCGIPMQAGNDTIRLTAIAQGTVGGINTTQNQSLNIPVQALPASADTVPDFIASADSACAPLVVSFSAAESAPGMNAVFSWDFGNGSIYNGAAPPDQTYAEGGTYPVTLQRAFSVPLLTQLVISGVSNSWCGDLDEPNLPIIGCVGQPDLYFTITDSRLALERSSLVTNAQSATWNNLSIPLAFPPFTLRVYDNDDLSDDDLLGTFTLDATTGSASFAQGGTIGSRQVQVQTVLTTEYTDTVVVFSTPSFTLGLDADAETICATDLGLASYEWALNGTSVSETGPCVAAANGLWSLVGTSAEGCSGSAELLVAGLGIDDRLDPLGFTVSPNPASDVLWVELEHALCGQADLTLLDASGRAVRNETLSVSDWGVPRPVDVSALRPGAYWVRLRCAAHQAQRRVMLLRR